MGKMINVYDNFLPNDTAVNLFTRLFDDKQWLPNWNKDVDEHGRRNSIWMKPVPGAEWQADVGYTNIDNLTDEYKILAENSLAKIQELTNTKHNILRMYCGGSTYGMDGHVHVDDGTTTALYYPNLDWNANWEGGTIFYNDELTDAINYTTCKFNRLAIFDPSIPHRHMGVTRNCFRLRMIIVMKCVPDYNDSSYMEKYNGY